MFVETLPGGPHKEMNRENMREVIENIASHKHVFVVLDGLVNMHYKENNETHIVKLNVGDIFYAGAGTEHVAHSVGEARILVVETAGSE